MMGRLRVGVSAFVAMTCASSPHDQTLRQGPARVGGKEGSLDRTGAPATGPSNWWRTHAGTDVGGRDSAIDVVVDVHGRPIVLALLAERAFGVLAYEKDGTLAWARSYRDPADDTDLATKVATDAAGNVYAAGSWQRRDVPLGGFLVVSFDSSGALRWSVRSDAGGGLSDLAVRAGRVVVTGRGTDGTHSVARTIAYDVNGNILWRASELGSFGLGATGRIVALDAGGRAYVAGEATNGGQEHLTVFAYDARGVRTWATRDDDDPEHVPQTTAQALALDVGGAPHVAFARAFRITRDAEPTVELAVRKYDVTGGAAWTAIIDEAARNIATAVAVDSYGRVTTTGFAGNTRPDSYLTAQLDPTGRLRWKERCRWDAPGEHEARGLALDGAGNAYVTGTAYGADGVPRFGSIGYDPNGRVLFREVDNASNDAHVAVALAVDRSGVRYVVGSVLTAPRGLVGVLRSSPRKAD
jgi:hypothetical protein